MSRKFIFELQNIYGTVIYHGSSAFSSFFSDQRSTVCSRAAIPSPGTFCNCTGFGIDLRMSFLYLTTTEEGNRTVYRVYVSIDWLIDWLIYLLIDWLMDRWIDRLIDWFGKAVWASGKGKNPDNICVWDPSRMLAPERLSESEKISQNFCTHTIAPSASVLSDKMTANEAAILLWRYCSSGWFTVLKTYFPLFLNIEITVLKQWPTILAVDKCQIFYNCSRIDSKNVELPVLASCI